jgi:hypothetical protein
MIYYGQYTLHDYILILYNYFSGRKFNAYEDIPFKMRITAVISYFCYMEKGTLDQQTFDSWTDEHFSMLDGYLANYFKPFLKDIKGYLAFVEPISKYLINLAPKAQLQLEGVKPRVFMGRVDPGVEIVIHINKWFEYEREMRAKKWK